MAIIIQLLINVEKTEEKAVPLFESLVLLFGICVCLQVYVISLSTLPRCVMV